jgi:hypothetical protein
VYEHAFVLHSYDPVEIVATNWTVLTREKLRQTYKSNSENGTSVLSVSTNANEMLFGIHMQSNDTSSIIIQHNNKNRYISNYNPFEYTKFVNVNCDVARECTLIHDGKNAFTIDYILFSN